MATIAEYNEYGRVLEEKFKLRYAPVAFKMLWEGDEIPEDCPRVLDRLGKRLAMCQAFSYVRRNRRAITLLAEDHWCVWPLACFKIFELDEDDYQVMGTKLFIRDAEKSVQFFKEKYPWLECNGKKPLGFSLAPLDTCSFVPDIIVTYCRVSQLRGMVKAFKMETGELIPQTLDTIASCSYCTIPMLNGQKYAVTLPDPGEYERALAEEDEIIFSVRGDELPNVMSGMKRLAAIPFGYSDLHFDMNLEFPRAQFYDDMAKKWGLKTGAIWKMGE